MRSHSITFRLDTRSLERLERVCERDERARAWVVRKLVKKGLEELAADSDDDELPLFRSPRPPRP